MSNEEVDLLEGEDKAVKAASVPAVNIVEDDAAGEDVIQEQRQDAYDAGNSWNGQPLEAFSSSRDSLFARVRCLMGAPDLKEVYQNLELFVGDAQLILFLCSHHHNELVPMMRDLEGMVLKVMAWSDENVPRDKSVDASILAMKIYNDSQVNAAEAVPTEGVEAGSELGN